MPRSERLPAVRIVCAAFLSLLLTGSVALPASAQTIRVQNGAVVEVNNGGVWDLQGGTMDFGPAGASTRLREEQAGRVTGGRLTATRDFGSPSQANPAGLGVVLSAAPDVGEITVIRGHTAQTASNGNVSIERYYDISVAQNNAGLDATLTVGYADAELNGIAESDLELFRSTDDGATWTEEGADSRDPQFNTVTLSGVERFSRWTLGSSSSPLPVELASFEAAKAQAGGTGEEAVQLTWTTAAEQNNAGFEVQRRIFDASAPGARRAEETGSWRRVGFRESTAAGGTTTEAQSYRFTDEALPYAADTLAYRLRQVDTDGSATLTDPVRVARGAVSSLQLKETYPNPARRRVTVRYAIPGEEAASDVTLSLYNVLGQRVRTAVTQTEAGRHEVQVPTHDLASGVYFLRLQAAEQIRTQKLTVVR